MQDIKNALALALMYMRQHDEENETLKAQIDAIDGIVNGLIIALKPQGDEFGKAMSAALAMQQTVLTRMEAAHRKRTDIMKKLMEVMTALAIPSDLTRQ
jgi:hypothetical protein